jgi:putative DNA primase/helicase
MADFNDTHQEKGTEAVKEQIGKAEKPSPSQETNMIRAVVERLATLPPLEYDRVREAEAEKLGVRVGTLDKAVAKAGQSKAEEQGMAAMFPDIEPWPYPVNGAELLHEIHATVKRFIVCDDETARAATLWIAFTWFIDRVQVAPLAIITAPEKRCGKSQLLSLIGMLSRRKLVASNISPAAIFRVVEAHSPTLLIDEADSFLRENEEARGIINSGHTRQTAYVIRVVGDDHEPKQFTTWGAKVICGIGTMPETLMDRAVVLELRRKLPHEKVERLRHADPEHFETLTRKLARFSDDAGDAIERARPALPDALNDRAQDNWEPLLAIADHAGGAWPDMARKAALRLSGTEQEAVSLSAELLADIREIFVGSRKLAERISTADLLLELNSDDLKPWATYNRGKPMTPRQLAKRLGEYGIKAEVIRSGNGTCRGFLRAWFEDAFNRYLSNIRNTVTSENNPIITGVFSVTHDPQPCRSELVSVTPNPLKRIECYGVTGTEGGLADMPDIAV